MRDSARCLLGVFLSTLVPLPLLAQTTGEMKGSVVDAAGAPLPGVSIEARSPALQAFRAATTNASGEFRLPVVPPGVYAVSARLTGFKPEEQSGIRVPLGETVTLPRLTLLLVASAETHVSGDVPLIDTANTKIGTSIPALMLTELPLGRNFADVMQTVTGSAKDYKVCNCDPSKTPGNTIFGATSLESGYIIDGLNTTGVLLGDQGKQLNLEFVQEVEVRTGGYEAEYGKAMGASINVITKSGGNDFHGGVFGYDDPASLASSDSHTDQRKALNLTMQSAPRLYDAGLDLGGYFLKDTLWFFGAFDRVANDTDYQRVDSLTYTPTSVISNYVGGTDVRQTSLFSGKLTLLAGQSQTFVASVFGDPSTYDGRNGLTGPASAALKRIENGGTDVVARWEGIFGANFLGQAQYGYHEEAHSGYSGFSDQVLFLDHQRGFLQAAPGSGPGGLGPGTLRRNSWGATATSFLGSHELKAGMAYELQNSSQQTYFSGGGQVDRWLTRGTGAFLYARHLGFAKSPLNCQVRTDGSVGNFGFVDPTTCNGWEPAAARDSSPRTQDLALFLQDSWRVLPNLTVNAGVRYEDQRLYDSQNQPLIKLRNEWSPRVGVVWDPLTNGRSKVYASYGRYYQTIPQEIQLALEAEPYVYAYNYTQNRLNLVADNNLVPYEYVNGADLVPPGLKGMYQDEVVVGVEAEVWKNWSVGIKGIYRSLGRALEDRCDLYDPRSGLSGSIPPVPTVCALMNPGEGEFGQLSDPANPDCWQDFPKSTIPRPCKSVRASRVFRGLELEVKRRISKAFQLQASYLYSKLVGNYDGFVNQTFGGAAPNVGPSFDTPDTLVNSYGRLSLDRTHQAKLTGFYVFPFGLHAGVNASFATGAPLSILGTASNGYKVYLQPRGSWDQLPSTYSVDVHLEYPLRFGSVTVTPLLDIFNLTNVQPATQQGEVYNNLINGNQSPPYTNPTVATFGQDTAWQSPRVVRLGARVNF